MEHSTAWGARRGGGLLILGQVAGLALRIGVQLALARLLPPADFGRFGLAVLVVTLLGVVVDGLVGPPTVRVGEDERATAAGAALAAGLGLALLLVTWALAPLVAASFGDPALTDILRIVGLGLLAGAATVAPAAVLERRQRFGRRLLASLGGGLTGALTALALALAGAGVAALVWGWVAGELVGGALTWWLADWWPLRAPSRAAIGQVLALGRATAGSGVLAATTERVDSAVVGQVLGLEALGYYGLATGWAGLPALLAGGPTVRALGPAYHQASAALDELGDLYLDVVRGGLAAALPAAVLLAVLGPVAALALLGPGWAPVGVLLPLLAPRLVAYGLGLSRGALLAALDRAHWQTGLLGVELLLLVVGLAPAAWLGGLPAVAGLVSGVALVTSLAGLVLARRRLALPARRLLAALGPPVAAAAAAGLVVLASAPARAALDPLPALIAGALPFLGTYALVLALLWARAAPADR